MLQNLSKKNFFLIKSLLKYSLSIGYFSTFSLLWLDLELGYLEFILELGFAIVYRLKINNFLLNTLSWIFEILLLFFIPSLSNINFFLSLSFWFKIVDAFLLSEFLQLIEYLFIIGST